jgi:UrcA family protein
MRQTMPTSQLYGALAAAALTLCGGGALAQSTTVEELTVTGHPKAYPETFSYRVSYADLDLKKEADRKELDRRIAVTAAFVCKRVDQPDSACRAEAVNQANKQEQNAIHRAQAHGEHAHGPAWVPPPGG